MNYRKIHDAIIRKAILEKRKKNKEIYYESHHIIPKCLGGGNEKENLILLSAREHFLIHWILTKIYPDNRKILYAFNCFCLTGKNNKRALSKCYKYAKEKHIANLKSDVDARQKNSEALKKKIWVVSPDGKCERVDRDSFAKLEKIGYKKGRILGKRKPHSEETKRKIGDANRNRVVSQETRQKLSKICGGKTYEEMYGPERAAELKNIRKIHMTNRMKSNKKNEN